jgi:hypothetical protein
MGTNEHIYTREQAAWLARGMPIFLYDDQIGCTCPHCTSKQAVNDESEPFKLDSALLGSDSDWTDVTFWFAWSIYSVLLWWPLMPIGLAIEYHWKTGDMAAAIGTGIAAMTAGFLVTVVTKYWHTWMAARDESICRRLGLECNSSYTKDAPPINVEDKVRDQMNEHMRWREADARNGIHRESSAVGDAPTNTIKRGTGLHRFIFTIGFQHEREE